MSKSSELDKTVKQYIIDHISNEGYSDNELTTNHDKIQFLKDTFYSEYGWAVDRLGEQKALREWYSGLPTACTVAFANHEILSLAEQWGSLSQDATERQQNKILENWFNLIAGKTGQLFRKFADN